MPITQKMEDKMANLNMTDVARENLIVAIAALKSGDDALVYYRTIWALCPISPDAPRDLMILAGEKALTGNILYKRVIAFLDSVESAQFDGNRPDDYHSQERVQGRYASWLKKRISERRFKDTMDLTDFFETEEADCNSSGEGWMSDIALACRAFVAMHDEIRLARGSKGRYYKRLHMGCARQWRESIRHSGFLGWF